VPVSRATAEKSLGANRSMHESWPFADEALTSAAVLLGTSAPIFARPELL
jgi:hypothetical protein